MDIGELIMGKEQDWRNLGEQILDSVAGALNSGDFSRLNGLVSGTVDNAVQEAKKQAEFERLSREEILRNYQKRNDERHQQWLKQQEELYKRREERREEWRKARQAQQDYRREADEREASRERAAENRAATPKVKKAKFHRTGEVSNVLWTVFGSLGLGVSGALGIVMLIMNLIGAMGPGAFALPIVLGTIAISMMSKGSRQRKLLKRAERYVQICGSKMYADVSEIAACTGNSVRFVKKDIKKMLRAGMFPEGHLDVQETCLMLSDEVYHQYTETAEAFRMREQMEADRRARENRPKTVEEEAEDLKRQQETELNAMMAEGMEYLRKLHDLNAAIPSEEISTQLSQLENLLKQIFDRVKEHPEQMSRMQKLMEYYLPTTVKLVEAYVQFEKVEKPGQDIKDAKAEIKKTLGIINEAFEELLNNLFQDDVFDATTDAQVLQAMLSREGLRRDMSIQNPQPQNEKYEEDEEEEEEEPFKLTLEPEQPEELPSLKAPWES